ncbi:MAG: hypothetical protein JST59_02655 [Actinobacteria bacterium]|nr:hypothetical protein [Actinomycetota bacterium]
MSGETQGYKQAMVPTTLWIRPNTVYIYDLVEKTIVYEKDFNCQIDYLKISNNFIAVSNAERVVIFHYKKELKKGVFKIGTVLEKIITGYEKGTFDDTVRYVEVEGAGMLNKGKLEMSLTDPTRLGFIKKERQSLYIYDSHLDIFLDVPMNKDEIDFSLSPDGKYAALISEGGVKIRVVEIDTRQTFTEFYRGSSLKPVAFSGFCQDWFALASLTDNNATLHFFPLRKQNTPTEVIYSQYKRYFNTFREPTNLFIKDNKVKVFSLVGCGFDVIDLIRARAKHAEDSSRVIKVKDVSFWAVDG